MIQLTPAQIESLETPCIVIDVQQAERNILAMQQAADKTGTALRPHIKTHKMPLFAQMQLAAGAKGITCAKVSEAEVMANGGVEDIFIAYPMVGAFRIQRAIALARRIKRLILAVDSLEGATALNTAGKAENRTLEVRLEVDTGAKRTGVLRQNATELAQQIAALENLNLTGIYTFKNLVYKGEPTENNQLAAEEEGELMKGLAEDIRNAGVPLLEVSAGSTPTGLAVAATGKVTEIRPGTYIFKDQMLVNEKAATQDEIAVRFYATVVSTPRDDFAVIDGGTKTFPTDIPIGVPPANYPGFALIEGREDVKLARMNEEHGILTTTGGKTGFKVGQKIALIPIHVCTAINMHNEVYLLDNGSLRRQKVEARGMLV